MADLVSDIAISSGVTFHTEVAAASIFMLNSVLNTSEWPHWVRADPQVGQEPLCTVHEVGPLILDAVSIETIMSEISDIEHRLGSGLLRDKENPGVFLFQERRRDISNSVRVDISLVFECLRW